MTNRPEAGWRIPVEIDAPDTARAVVINLTATNATVGGYLTAEDCKARPDGDRATSNTNYAAGRDAANLAIVPIVDGRICIYRSTAVHSIVDVVGYLSDEVVNEPVVVVHAVRADPARRHPQHRCLLARRASV